MMRAGHPAEYRLVKSHGYNVSLDPLQGVLMDARRAKTPEKINQQLKERIEGTA